MKGYKIGFSEIDDGNGNPYLCHALIELEIPERYPGAKFYSFRSQIRSNVARVIRINKLNVTPRPHMEPLITLSCEQLNSAFSIFDHNFYYRPGEIVYPDHFEDETIICTNGIHFFTYRQEAMEYVLNDWVWNKFLYM